MEIYNLGELLKECRIKQRLTQTQVAKRLNYSRATICAYESNTIKPSLDALTLLARLYKVSTDYLLNIDKREVIVIDGLTDNQITILRTTALEFERCNKEIIRKKQTLK